MPSVKLFAECYISGTRQRANLPRVTLGKTWHSAKSSFAECQTLGKVWRSAKAYFAECRTLGKRWHSTKNRAHTRRPLPSMFAECQPSGTRQNISFAECIGRTLGKLIFFLFSPPYFFVWLSYTTWYNIFKIGNFFTLFAIFLYFISFNLWILWMEKWP
jgi:hypothetical protein